MEWVHEHWSELTTLAGLLVAGLLAYSRLESKSQSYEKRLDHLEQAVDHLESGLVKELSEVKQSLARIEGYLKAKSEFNN